MLGYVDMLGFAVPFRGGFCGFRPCLVTFLGRDSRPGAAVLAASAPPRTRVSKEGKRPAGFQAVWGTMEGENTACAARRRN